jgi:ABC-2 type transport system permease protein
MGAFQTLLSKEFREIVRTWRIWVLPGIVLFFALTGPPVARFTPQLLQAMAPSTGMVIEVPDPTYADAYLQWTSNLAQIVLFALIILLGGVISSERRSGTALMVLTKPLSRREFILAKFLAQGAFITGTVIVGAAATWAVTWAVFGEAPWLNLATATGAWLIWAWMFVAIMLFLSALLGSQAGAAGLGLAAFALLSIPAIWDGAARFTPSGLLGAPTQIVMGTAGALFWPMITTIVLTAVAVAGAMAVFARKEL